MTTTTPTPGALDLDKLEALARAATPGPWIFSKYGSVMDGEKIFEIVPADTMQEDRAYIAAANPAAVLNLIALARRAAQPADTERCKCGMTFGDCIVTSCENGADTGLRAAQPSAEKAAEGELPPLPKAAGCMEVVSPADPRIAIFANAYSEEQYRQGQRDAIAASRRAAMGKAMYQAQFDGEYGSSVWHDVTEAAYHTFVPKHRRIVYATPAPESAAQAEKVACKSDKCESGRIYNTEHTHSMPCPDCPTERAPAPAEPFGYYIVEGGDMPYPGSGFVRTLDKGRSYKSVTPLFTVPVKAAAKGAAALKGGAA